MLNFVAGKTIFLTVSSSKKINHMFHPTVYKKRRDLLRSLLNGGIVVALGVQEVAVLPADARQRGAVHLGSKR